LSQIGCRLQPMRAWPLASVLVVIQLYLQAQIVQVQIVALTQRCGDLGLQGFLLIR
jgi:hypothetical protein